MKRTKTNPEGFTLIEVLIVVALIAIAMSTVVTSFSGSAKRQQIRTFSEQLQNKIELARDKAVQQNQEWGLRSDKENLLFVVFDTVNQKWMPLIENPFQPIPHLRFALVKIKAEKQERIENQDEDDFPELIMFSSGEVSPFQIQIRSKILENELWVLSSNGLSKTRITRDQT